MDETNGKATIREVYEIARRIESKMDARFDLHENRIRSLELWRSGLLAGGGVILTLIGLVIRSLH